MKKINDTLNDDPGKVDLNLLHRLINDLKRNFHILKSLSKNEKKQAFFWFRNGMDNRFILTKFAARRNDLLWIWLQYYKIL